MIPSQVTASIKFIDYINSSWKQIVMILNYYEYLTHMLHYLFVAVNNFPS